MSTKATNELEKSPNPARKRSKGAPSAAQQVDSAAASPSVRDQWFSVESKVLLLQTFLRISEERGVKPSYDEIYEAIQGSIPNQCTRDKVGNKLRDLKRKFLRAQSGATPRREDLVYQLSEKIWGGAADTEVAVTPKAKPTTKRKEKTPVISAPSVVQKEEAVVADEDSGRPRKSPRSHNLTPGLKQTSKRKTKKTPEVAAINVLQEEGETVVAEEDVERPPKSPRDHNITPAPRPKKEKTKSKRLELVATGRSSSEFQREDHGRMLPGLVRILQQVYPEASEKALLSALESMDDLRIEEIKKNWYQLQAVKLQVASLSANLAILLTQALQ